MCARSFGSNSGGSSSTANCYLHGSSIFIYDLTLKLNNMHYKHINRHNLLFDLPILLFLWLRCCRRRRRRCRWYCSRYSHGIISSNNNTLFKQQQVKNRNAFRSRLENDFPLHSHKCAHNVLRRVYKWVCIRYSVYGCRAPRHLGGMLSRLAFHFICIYFGFPLCRWWCVRILWIVIETRRYGLDCHRRRRPNEKKIGFWIRTNVQCCHICAG